MNEASLMRSFRHSLVLLVLGVSLLVPLLSQGQSRKGKARGLPGSEEAYYRILTFTPPKGEVLEAGAIEVLPDGRVAVGTRRGEVWMIDNAYDPDPKKAKFTRFAHGLHEVL